MQKEDPIRGGGRRCRGEASDTVTRGFPSSGDQKGAGSSGLE